MKPGGPVTHNISKSFHSAEESDCLTEYEEDGMDTVREEEGEEEEEEAEDPEDHSPGEWGQNGVFQTVSTHNNKTNRTNTPVKHISAWCMILH